MHLTESLKEVHRDDDHDDDAETNSGTESDSNPATQKGPGSLWLASEPLDGKLDDLARHWNALVKDEMVVYSIEEDDLDFFCLSDSCEEDRSFRSRLLKEEL